MTEKQIETGNLRLVNSDCVELMRSLPDSSIDLVVTDPPYFRVKRDAWDNQWADEADFMAWLDDVLFEIWRVLKPCGSLYLFCSDRLAAKTEVLIGQRFNVLNHIVWRKENGVHKRHHKESLRRFAGQTERIIFAEHYGSEGSAKGPSLYAPKCRQLRAKTFQPLIDYFANAKTAAGISSKAINEATSTQMSSHWFTSSQWKLPTEKQYEKLQQLFAEHGRALGRSHEELTKSYSLLNRDYLYLKRQVERVRRPFSVTADVPYTDVWDFNPVQYYQGKHPCEKPAELIRHMLKTSGRDNCVVLDPFMGSGVTGIECARLGFRFIGVEMDESIFAATCKRFNLPNQQPNIC